ncbi:MAG: ankyrin repeat domain-containing protein, partial [Phormidesmis sp.]
MENLTTQLAELFAAIESSNIPQIRRLLAANVSPNHYNANGQTALMLAAQMGNPTVIELLCAATANGPRPAPIFFETIQAASEPVTSVQNLTTQSPMIDTLACERLVSDALAAFENIASSAFAPSPVAANVTPTFSSTKKPANAYASLRSAVYHNDVGRVKALLKFGTDFRSVNWYDTPVLVIAAQKGYTDIVQALISAGANVNTGYDRLPLQVAAEQGHLDVVQRLLNSGADVNSKEESGQTALMLAASNGHLPIVKILISRGANVNAVCQGETALMLAAQKGHQAVHQFLDPYAPSQPPPSLSHAALAAMVKALASTAGVSRPISHSTQRSP